MVVHRIDAEPRPGSRRALGGVLVLSLVVSGAMEGRHSHTETAESSHACALCVLTHHAPITAVPQEIGVAPQDDRSRTPPSAPIEPARSRIRPPVRARAPPAPISS